MSTDLERARQSLHDNLIPNMEKLRVVLTSLKSCMHIEQSMLKIRQSRLGRLLHTVYGLGGCPGLGERWFWSRIGVSVNEGMP